MISYAGKKGVHVYGVYACVTAKAKDGELAVFCTSKDNPRVVDLLGS